MTHQIPFRSQCTCPCHTYPGMMHFVACCVPDPVEQVTVRLTDKRLTEMLAAIPRYADGSVRSAAWVARIPAPDIFAILTELSERRAKPELTEARKIAERLKGMVSPLELTDRVLSIRRDLDLLLDTLSLYENK